LEEVHGHDNKAGKYYWAYWFVRDSHHRLVCHHGGQDIFEKRFAIAQELKVGRVVSKIDGDGAVFAGPFGGCAHVSPPGHQVSSADETQWGEHVAISRQS
jgi:hypothetical protein